MGSSQSNVSNTDNLSFKSKFTHYAPMLGITLVIGGILLFIDQKIHTGWIPFLLPVVFGLILLAYGYLLKEVGWLISGFAITGLAGALFIIFQPFVKLGTNQLIGIGLAFFSLSWLGLFISLAALKRSLIWWSIFISTISFALAIVFLVSDFSILIFTLAITLAIGSTFLIWGLSKKSLGLQMTGLLTSTVGIGVFNGWKTVGDINGLRDTGNMLVWFSLGWILIVVFSRIFKKRFIWWPLIPGGILAMVGSGLYIGGNPENAAGFIQNTGSIGLVLLGVYLILLKYGLKK